MDVAAAVGNAATSMRRCHHHHSIIAVIVAIVDVVSPPHGVHRYVPTKLDAIWICAFIFNIVCINFWRSDLGNWCSVFRLFRKHRTFEHADFAYESIL